MNFFLRHDPIPATAHGTNTSQDNTPQIGPVPEPKTPAFPGAAFSTLMPPAGKRRIPIFFKVLPPTVIAAAIIFFCVWLYIKESVQNDILTQVSLRAEALVGAIDKFAAIDGHSPSFVRWADTLTTEHDVDTIAISMTGTQKNIVNSGEDPADAPTLEKEVDRRFRDPALTDAVRRGKPLHGLFKNYLAGDMDYIYVRPVILGADNTAKKAAAVVFIQLESESYFDKLDNKMRKIALLMGGAMALFIWFVHLLLQRVVIKPIQGIQQAVLARAQGQKNVPARVNGCDEISSLAEDFNHMLDATAAMEEIRLDKKIAEAANKAKSEFLANMSHELRTPMHAILSYSQIALKKLETGGDENLKKFIGNIRISGNRLLALLNDLLDLSKLEAGKMTVDPQPGDLHQAMDYGLTELHALIAGKKLQVKVTGAEIAGAAAIPHDKNLIIQVFINLLSNAIKFSPPESKIDIEYAPAGSGLICSVTNYGSAIPENEMEAIFDPFIQSSMTKNRAGGTGLGLSICCRIIQAHHGEIWAENLPDGVTFHVQIPLEQPATASG
jgi:signal transduction histidine kinase